MFTESDITDEISKNNRVRQKRQSEQSVKIQRKQLFDISIQLSAISCSEAKYQYFQKLQVAEIRIIASYRIIFISYIATKVCSRAVCKIIRYRQCQTMSEIVKTKSYRTDRHVDSRVRKIRAYAILNLDLQKRFSVRAVFFFFITLLENSYRFE